jgi:hypothetical protein
MRNRAQCNQDVKENDFEPVATSVPATFPFPHDGGQMTASLSVILLIIILPNAV